MCDILDCTPADLIEHYVEASARRAATSDGGATIVGLKPDLRPERARILDND